MLERTEKQAPWQALKGDFIRFKDAPANALAQLGIFPHQVPFSIPHRGALCQILGIEASDGIKLRIKPLKVVTRKQFIAGELVKGKIEEYDPVLTKYLEGKYFPKELFEPVENVDEEYE